MMGSGKSTLGKKLANRLGWEWIDLDQAIESATGESIPHLFKLGEAHFRKVEADTLRALSMANPMIISCGGGTPCFHQNMTWMNQVGTTIYLDLTPKALHSRLGNETDSRPLLAGVDAIEQVERLEKMLVDRLPFYQQAQITLPGLSVTVNQVLEALGL